MALSGSGYLATFTYLSSESAAGAFLVSVVDSQGDTFLANSSLDRLAYDAGSGTVINVAIGCLTDPDCDDGNDCTVDACTANSCTHINAASGTSCDDGLFCTTPDECDGAGTCGGGLNDPCGQNELCSEFNNTCVPERVRGSGT